MCVQLEFTIHRGTHLCPPTPLAHTREESRTLRSRIVNTTLEMSLEVECHWCLGMGEEGEEPRDRTSPPQLRPISLQPFARVERPRARAKSQSQEPSFHCVVEPIASLCSSHTHIFTHSHTRSCTHIGVFVFWDVQVMWNFLCWCCCWW